MKLVNLFVLAICAIMLAASASGNTAVVFKQRDLHPNDRYGSDSFPLFCEGIGSCLPAECFESFKQAKICRDGLIDKPANLARFNKFASDYIMFQLSAEAQRISDTNKREGMTTIAGLADSLREIRTGVARGCFEGFVHETGGIMNLQYDQWYEDDGSHAPLSYQVYLTNSPVSAPVAYCASGNVYITTTPGVIAVCDDYHTAMTYCYIGQDLGCVQPEQCPV